MVEENLRSHIEKSLSSKQGQSIKVTGTQALSGGCINKSVLLKTNKGSYFLKWNHSDKYPKMFETEVHGLKLLRSSGAIGIPGVVEQSQIDNTSYLLLDFIVQGKEIKNYYEKFGSAVARMHEFNADSFGLECDNYIGSLKQSNRQYKNGTTFFIEERLKKQIYLAQEKGLMPIQLKRKFSAFFERLSEIFPTEKPALLHGDLWSGNYITGKDGSAWLIDPAVYYGFRESDIAMTRLFGGFNDAFYSTYNEEYPLERGWEERVDYFNLYPLLVHLNLFGSSYLNQIQNILSKF